MMDHKDKINRRSALFQITVSFLVLYAATVVVIFIPDFDHDIIRFFLLSGLFIISFLFQFYVLEQQVLSERKRKNQLSYLLEEQDRTARMLIRRDRALSQANQRLRELDKLKSEFVSVAAHQIRTPLSGIKWSLDMLANEHVGPVNAKQKRILLKSYESNERMILLVNNLLNTDRIESGMAELNKKRLNLKDILDNLLYYISPQARSKNIDLNVSGGDLPLVEVDPEKIREVIQNILENAVKYTEEDGHIEIKMYTKNDNVVIEVADDGIGIPEKFQNKIFTKFNRGENAVKVKTEGSGLGLFVAKEITERHGGKISFESEEGVGTTFYIHIPVADSEDDKNE
ncbi:MAG: sensor histidine kinase [Candidatus Paceibacterota bacterium]